MRVILTEQQAQALVDYLAQRPYADVAPLIAAIMEGREEPEEE